MAHEVTKKIVCLGGGIGTSNLLKGLKHYNLQITAITSMADDGGSSGRLRKAYNIMPPGDIVSCISALIPDEQHELAELLTHRFPGLNRNKELGGHKLGNLIMLAEIQRTGDFYKALDSLKRIFGVKADILPATDERTRLSAITRDGRRVHSETTLDLALYSQPHGLKKIYISPKNPNVNKKVISNIIDADCIVSGPGDLYTNQLPVLIVPQIKQALIESPAKKLFILNIANKPFETKGFALHDFISAISDHLGTFPFEKIIINNNRSYPIPPKYRYKYIDLDVKQKKLPCTLIEEDLVDPNFPIFHDTKKLAYTIVKCI